MYNQYLVLVGGSIIVNSTVGSISRELYVANTSNGISWYRGTRLLLVTSETSGVSLYAMNLTSGVWASPVVSDQSVSFLGLPLLQSPPQLSVGACAALTTVDVAGSMVRKQIIVVYGQVVGGSSSYVYLLDLDGVRWFQESNLNQNRNGMGCVGVNNGVVLLGGVQIDTSATISVNSSNWTQMESSLTSAPLSVSDPIALFNANDVIYLYGGSLNTGIRSGNLSAFDVEAKNPSWKTIGENVLGCCGASVYDSSRDIVFVVFPGGEKTISSLNYQIQTSSWISNEKIPSFRQSIPSPVSSTTNPPTATPTSSSTDSTFSVPIVGIVVSIVAVILIAGAVIVYLKMRNKNIKLFNISMWISKRSKPNNKINNDHETREPHKIEEPNKMYGYPKFSSLDSKNDIDLQRSTWVQINLPNSNNLNESSRSETENEQNLVSVQNDSSLNTGLPRFQADCLFTATHLDEVTVEPGDWLAIDERDMWSDGWCLGINETSGKIGVFPVTCFTLGFKPNESSKTLNVIEFEFQSPRASLQDYSLRLSELKKILEKAVTAQQVPLVANPPKSAMKTPNSLKRPTKTVKIVAPRSSFSDTDSVIDHYETMNSNSTVNLGGLSVPSRQSSRDFVLPAK
ncbi:hypothetical protein HK096_009487 [Nowakowskiella sp. JEL0078]|nr:hypothetical protein HK096_009487 [Nowakowskiella sp. JEL0078]